VVRQLSLNETDEGGSTVLEAAVIIPAAMLVILLAVQACLWAHAATLVQNAAIQGDQAATVMGGSSSAGIAQAQSVLDETAAHVVIDPLVTTEQLQGGLIQVRVTGSAESILPGIRLPVSAVRQGVIQEFRQSG
jgi:TadE-like protein